VYLANADWEVPCIEVGYFTVQDQGGKGYAAEATRTACRIAFERLGVRRVELQCAADNEKSARVARRCGFTLEGRLRERHPKKDGPPVDRLWFGLLRFEWRPETGEDYSSRRSQPGSALG
jgi:ribosomal-protein-serine acetyltransferase